MALVDDVKITVKAGDGGNGATATKQIYGSKKTAPDGGNGGNGGNIYFLGSSNVSDLSEFQYKKTLKAQNGISGQHKDLDGANGVDLYVKVPFGTTIQDKETNEWVEILTEEPFCVAYGGQGGMGNHDYKPNPGKLQPRIAQGGVGDERKLHLILNLIADVGLVGLPNAGKSSLLKKLTNATPKVGNYPFTTIEPNLGALGHTIIADIPGLIEGASEGKGLGLTFLKHIKKTKMLLHCIASDEENVAKTYQTVRDEFAKYDEQLLTKKEIVLLTKCDLVTSAELLRKCKELEKIGKIVMTVSIYKEDTLKELEQLLQSST